MAEIRRLHPDKEQGYKQAPNNIEAEQALLGAILVNNEAFYRVSDFLEPDHFYEAIHRQIYEVAAKIIQAGKKADPITVKTFLPTELIEGVSMQQYLARLATEVTTVINAYDFGRVVYDLAIRRQLILIGEEMTETAYEADVDMTPDKQIEDAEKQLFDLAERGHYEGGFQPFNTALTASIRMASEAYQRDGKLSGIATGLTDLDRMMGGLQRSDLVILASRPAMGKSSLATSIALNVARAFREEPTPEGQMKTVNGGRVGFFSLEMSAEQLATRILSDQTRITSSDIRRGNIHDSQYATLVETSQMINDLPIFIDDTGGLSIAQLVARARRLKRQKGIDLIIIDYVQLLTGSSRRSNDNRVLELTEITTSLKALAKEMDIPVLALAQLSRQVEMRDDKRPQLADLRESGSIEQDADVVLFIFRDEYYLKNKEPKEGTPEHLAWQGEMEKVHGLADIIIGKQRHGPTGTVKLAFEANFTRFSNLARDAYVPDRIE